MNRLVDWLEELATRSCLLQQLCVQFNKKETKTDDECQWYHPEMWALIEHLTRVDTHSKFHDKLI